MRISRVWYLGECKGIDTTEAIQGNRDKVKTAKAFTLCRVSGMAIIANSVFDGGDRR